MQSELLIHPELILPEPRPSGLLSNRDLNRAGISSKMITQLVKDNVLERRIRGWYRIVGAEIPPEQDLFVAQLYLARRQRNCCTQSDDVPPSLLTGGRAMDVYGVEVDLVPPTMLIDVDRRVRVPTEVFTILRAHLSAEAWCKRKGLYLPEPPRAVGDYAGENVSDLAVRTTVDRLRFIEGMKIVEAVDKWQDTKGPGFRRLVAMAREGVFDTESEGERRFFNDVLCLGGPLPDCQVWVTPRIRVDFLFIRAALVLEYHGKRAHRDQVDADAMRRYELDRLGLQTLVVTSSMTADPVGLWRHIHQLRQQGIADIAAGRRPPVALPPQGRRLRPLRSA